MTVDLHAREIKPLRNTFAHVAKYVGDDKPASRYQEATLGAQPTSNFHYRPTWDPQHELFDASRSAVVLADWYVLRDPRQYYYGTWTMARARQQDAMETNYQFVESRGLLAKMPDATRAKACAVLMPLRHVAWGGNMNNCFDRRLRLRHGVHRAGDVPCDGPPRRGAVPDAPGPGADEPGVLEAGKNDWLGNPHWQVLRRYVEDTLVLKDPFELFVAQNLALDGQLYPLIYGNFVDEHLALQGGTAVSMLTSFMPEWHEESRAGSTPWSRSPRPSPMRTAR